MRACQLLGSSDRLDYSDCSNLFHVLSVCRVFHQSPSIRYALLGSIQAIIRLRGDKVSGVALTKQHRAIGIGRGGEFLRVDISSVRPTEV